MLDVHPPHHATHGWRDFFIHIATITVGLLIAVGLEQSVEQLDHRHQRHELEEQLHAEAERNLDLVHRNILRLKAMNSWAESAIVALNTAPVVNGQIKRSVLPAPQKFNGSIWDPSRTVWTVAKASGAVALLPEDEAQVYARIDFEGESLYEIGYHLRRDLWRQGLATEAAIACRDWAFANLKTDRLISLIRPENLPSRRVAERVGMTVWKEVAWRGLQHCVYSATKWTAGS